VAITADDFHEQVHLFAGDEERKANRFSTHFVTVFRSIDARFNIDSGANVVPSRAVSGQNSDFVRREAGQNRAKKQNFFDGFSAKFFKCFGYFLLDFEQTAVDLNEGRKIDGFQRFDIGLELPGERVHDMGFHGSSGVVDAERC